MCTEKWEGKLVCVRACACVCMCLVLPEILTLQNLKCKADLFGTCLSPCKASQLHRKWSVGRSSSYLSSLSCPPS